MAGSAARPLVPYLAMNVSQIYDNENPIELEIKVAKEAAN